MLNLKQIQNREISGEVTLPLSKSIANRYLLIKALNETLSPGDAVHDSNDSKLLYKALSTSDAAINFEDAGTPLRFFLAYAALRNNTILIEGNERLRQRPLKPLLLALESLGAEFTYSEEPYHLPLRIVKPIDRENTEVEIDATVSSQFISALMLIAPYFKKGLKITMKGEMVSTPYLYTTQFCMDTAGVYADIDEEDGIIHIERGIYHFERLPLIEPDWSAACFVFAWVALSEKAKLFLPGLRKDSAQGDAIALHIFKEFGVHAVFRPDGLMLSKTDVEEVDSVFDVEDIPDCFPVLLAVCALKKRKAVFFGIANLQHKESDRVEAMAENVKQCGVIVKRINDDSIELQYIDEQAPTYMFKSFDDHRIAMACSLFAFEKDIRIDNETVVAKSFPAYWNLFTELLYRNS